MGSKKNRTTPIRYWHAAIMISFLLLEISCQRINHEEVIEGRHGQLYQAMFIRDYTGERLLRDYSNEEEAKVDAKHRVETTKALIDSLRHRDKIFLFVFVPSKTIVYQDDLPKRIRNQRSRFSLEEYYIRLFKENGIPHIDFYSYFQDLRKKHRYRLYSPYGSHWAQGTMPMVGDSILRMIEAISDYRLPSIEITDINLTTDYTRQDAELETMLDLPHPLPRKPLPRPICQLTDTLDKDQPNLLVVGDGDFVPLRNSCFVEAFNQWDFWEYNRNEVSSRPWIKKTTLEDCPYAYQILDEADIILGIMTAPYFYQYFFGFEQRAFQLWEHGPLSQNELIELKMKEIAGNRQWYDAIVKQAHERGVTVEENLRLNATYVIQMQQNKP